MNSDMFKDIKALDDEKLRSLIRDIGSAIGADARKTEALAGDLNAVRRTVGGISESEAKRLIDMAGKEKAEKIYEAIKRGTR